MRFFLQNWQKNIVIIYCIVFNDPETITCIHLHIEKINWNKLKYSSGWNIKLKFYFFCFSTEFHLHKMLMKLLVLPTINLHCWKMLGLWIECLQKLNENVLVWLKDISISCKSTLFFHDNPNHCYSILD